MGKGYRQVTFIRAESFNCLGKNTAKHSRNTAGKKTVENSG